MRKVTLSGGLLLLAAAACVLTDDDRAGTAPRRGPTWRSCCDVAFSPNGELLAASDYTAGTVAIVSPSSGKVLRQVAVRGAPAGLAWSPDGGRVFVAEEGAGTVAELDPSAGKVLRRFEVGRYPADVAVAGRLLLATNSGLGSLSAIDLDTGKETARIPMVHQPRSVAVAPGGKLAVVGNFLPLGDARDFRSSATVSLVDLTTLKRSADVRLPGGSTLLRDVAVGPEGKWAYAVHTVGRFTLPTTQLERGWVNTNAMSIIRLPAPAATAPAKEQPQEKAANAEEGKGAAAKQPGGAGAAELYATVLFDHISEGAADPWGLAIAPDGKALWATLSGVHQLARVDLARLHPLLAGKVSKDLEKTLNELDRYRRAGVQVTWLEVRKDPAHRSLLVNDLTAMYVAGALRRTKLPGRGPRGLSVAPDGKTLAVGAYFSGSVLLADGDSGEVARTVPLGPQGEPDEVRRGEMIFHDATYCFQHWLSCATCHPAGRADGLNWDLLNDGMGNPKNSKSLVWSHRTPPAMASGVRENMEVASEKGFRFILFRVPEKAEDRAVQAYLRSLAPAASPYLAGGRLSPAARRGRQLYAGKANCAGCHPAPLYTDLRMYDVGTRHELDRRDDFDNPTLIEMWRTAPYLHDGSAGTLREVLVEHNRTDRHGTTSKLSPREIDDLVEYLRSL